MSRFTSVITGNGDQRDVSLDVLCRGLTIEQLLDECRTLERFRRDCDNLYERVRALFFLYAIHRFHIPKLPVTASPAAIPFAGFENLLERRFEEAIEVFLAAQEEDGSSAAISSALAASYRALGFQTLADQVRRSVRSVRGNQWMFRAGHTDDYPLRLRSELFAGDPVFPILREATPVRMDLTHSGWSDIFFLGMDYPEGARVINVSIDLAVRAAGEPADSASAAQPRPPVEAWFRVIDQPVIRLTSVDLHATADVSSIAEVFDFPRDYLGLLKAGIIASGIVPPGIEGATQPLAALLERLTGRPGYGIEIVSSVNNIPKGSRLAVSTNLLACIIAVCMRATSQIRALTGGMDEQDRRLVAARAILGEWLGGSGGGWQDSGGVWPGIKLIHGVCSAEGDPEFGISRGRLLPDHKIFSMSEISSEARKRLQQSLVLVHGGMAQDVGPILEMVTEKYLLRSETEWVGRRQAIGILEQITGHLERGDMRALGRSLQENFEGPLQSIIPWAANLYTNTLIERARQEFGPDFWGFWMLGGMSGGGMGFLFSPKRKQQAQGRMQSIMSETKRSMEHSVPFAMEPVVYEFAINEQGSQAALHRGDDALMPGGYYTQQVPALVRTEMPRLSPVRRAELERFTAACRTNSDYAGMIQTLFDHMLPAAQDEQGTEARTLQALLDQYGFDRKQQEQVRQDLRSGRIGLAQNRLPTTSLIEDAAAAPVDDRHRALGLEALAAGRVAVVSLAGGVGTRWTRGAGVVKALNPFCKLGGRYRNFIEVHLAKSLRVSRECGTPLLHVITTSYLTHEAIAAHLAGEQNYGYPGPLLLSPGRAIGLRMVPMVRDLRFAWEEVPQQLLDAQAQKVREGLHSALIRWAQSAGEGSDYTSNVPMQCLHPVGHWYEVANLLRNGTLQSLLEERPQLNYLMVHNIDTVAADADPGVLGFHIQSGAALTTEVIARHLEDRGGGLARVDGRVRLIEGLALPSEELESRLSYYNSATYWIDVDRLLAVFGLTRGSLFDTARVDEAVRILAARMPTYITLKDVKRRWGKGQEDIFPVAQFEKLWGDMTALPELACCFVEVPRVRGRQLKEPAQLDAWLRDGSAAYAESLCTWREKSD
ncbi:MAG TPA: UTP--glucose-1-phosphate uridylyltransferase [Terracidiphilus sp.]|nr:UTP--glucose-1-phosphate uridylyltransferase [Terracidiphilus sp.]